MKSQQAIDTEFRMDYSSTIIHFFTSGLKSALDNINIFSTKSALPPCLYFFLYFKNYSITYYYYYYILCSLGLKMEISPSDTIHNMKLRIFNAISIEPAKLQFTYRGRILENGQTAYEARLVPQYVCFVFFVC